jgi:hypothetical protein
MSLYPNNQSDAQQGQQQQQGLQQQQQPQHMSNNEADAENNQHKRSVGWSRFQHQTVQGLQQQQHGHRGGILDSADDNIVGVVFNANHALMDSVGMKQLVQYFISLVTDTPGGRVQSPPDVVMEPAVVLNRETVPGLRGKHVPSHYLPLDPQARGRGHHEMESSASSLTSEELQRDFGMYRRLSKQEVKQLKKMEKREEKFAKEEDEHRYQIEKEEYIELKGIAALEGKAFARVEKLERKEHALEDKEMRERSKIEYKEMEDQQAIARKALKYRISGIVVINPTDHRRETSSRSARGPARSR